MSRARGFTLLEVTVSLLILGLSLGALLQVQARNLEHVGRARDLIVATALARGKAVELEVQAQHDGYATGIQVREGDFAEEGHPAITYQARLIEVRMEADQLIEAYGAKLDRLGADKVVRGGEMGAMLGMLGPVVGDLLSDLSASVRLVDLKVAWPAGRQERSLNLRWLIAPDNFALLPPGVGAAASQVPAPALTGGGR